MNMSEIVNNAVRYPFLGFKNVLIFGIMIFTGLFIGFTSVFFNGYQFRIIKSSLNGDTEPPEFNNWIGMFIDGVKMYLVGMIYTIPAILIIIIFGSMLITSLHFFTTTPSSFIGTFSIPTIVVALIIIAYIIIIIPIIMTAIAYMADNNGDINAAFRVREVLDKISSLGWINFIKWFIITVIPVFIITIAVSYVTTYISDVIHLPLNYFLLALIAAPLFMYLARSFSLFYMSGKSGVLECENCGGYYELQLGESSEDFDKCQCGGKLKYIQTIPSNNHSDKIEAKNMDKLRSMINLNKKRNLTIIILLALGITAIPFLISSTHALTPTPIKYTLLGTYNVNNTGDIGKVVIIPQGTKNIKIYYNISGENIGGVPNNLNVDSYNSKIPSPGNQNLIDDKNIGINEGQNKTGTFYFNNPEIKSLNLEAYNIQGTVKIYTSQ